MTVHKMAKILKGLQDYLLHIIDYNTHFYLNYRNIIFFTCIYLSPYKYKPAPRLYISALFLCVVFSESPSLLSVEIFLFQSFPMESMKKQRMSHSIR
jgi:hypothetical protein